MFDKKFKTIVKCECKPDYLDMLEWVNQNSNGAVDTKFVMRFNAQVGEVTDTIFLAFEDKDDALIFKIKYSV